MDYSHIPQDSDHPAGASPWVSSPRQSTRPSYSNSASGSEPPSPLLTEVRNGRDPIVGSAAGQEALVESERMDSDEGTGQSDVVRANGSSTGFSNRSQGATKENYVAKDPQPSLHPRHHPSIQSEAHQQDGHHDKPAHPNRHQAGVRPQRNAPQYKLQAKITGLERTGRKDPILRFDVHVCDTHLYRMFVLTLMPKDKSSQIPDHTIS